jgi:predicted HD phosphohydrolase
MFKPFVSDNVNDSASNSLQPLYKDSWQYITVNGDTKNVTKDRWIQFEKQKKTFLKETLADRVLILLESLKNTPSYCWPLSFYSHCLQAATRALRAKETEEMIVVALLHDIGIGISPYNHEKIIGAILGPFVSEDLEWLLYNHDTFIEALEGSDRTETEKKLKDLENNSRYKLVKHFCDEYDYPSEDPSYISEPLSTFEPMVRRIFSREPRV